MLVLIPGGDGADRVAVHALAVATLGPFLVGVPRHGERDGIPAIAYPVERLDLDLGLYSVEITARKRRVRVAQLLFGLPWTEKIYQPGEIVDWTLPGIGPVALLSD